SSLTHPETAFGKIALGFARSLFGEVEDGRRRHRARAGLPEHAGHVGISPAAARGDHRNVHGRSDIAHQVDVVARPGTVALDRSEQDLARSEAFDLPRPLDRVSARRGRPAAGHYLWRPVCGTLHVD